MDLEAVSRLTGRSGHVARVGALLCFLLAGGLLLGPSGGPVQATSGLATLFATR